MNNVGGRRAATAVCVVVVVAVVVVVERGFDKSAGSGKLQVVARKTTKTRHKGETVCEKRRWYAGDGVLETGARATNAKAMVCYVWKSGDCNVQDLVERVNE